MRFPSKIKPPKSVLAISITVLIFGAGSYLLGWSSLFTVSQIEISGAPTPESEKEISKRLNLPIGQKLARVDCALNQLIGSPLLTFHETG
jgi:cell division septal protein FtsQ